MKPRILIVDSDSAALNLLQANLTTAGYDVLAAAGSEQACQAVQPNAPVIILGPWRPAGSEIMKLCRMLRSSEPARTAYILLLIDREAMDRMREVLEAGADDFVTAPVNREELLSRVRMGERLLGMQSELTLRNSKIAQLKTEAGIINQQLAEVTEKLQRLSSVDDLSGLLNRREAMAQLRTLWAMQERYKNPFACLVVDIDHFERVNDTYGNAVGDRALREIARVLRRNVRKTDVVCRLGGEEFLVLCPNVCAKEGSVCGEHLRTAVSQHAIVHEGVCLQLTVSIGVAERTTSLSGPEDLLRLADRAMHASKRAGRNRVTVAGPAMLLGTSQRTPATMPR